MRIFRLCHAPLSAPMSGNLSMSNRATAALLPQCSRPMTALNGSVNSSSSRSS
jgi:hypothetical protein